MTKLNSSKPSLWNKQYLLNILLVTIFNVGSFGSLYLVSYCVELGGSVSSAGFVVSLMSIISLCIRPFSGLISDRFSQKKLVILSMWLMALANVGYFFARGMSVMIVFRVIHGIGSGIGTTVMGALIGASVPRERLSEAFAYQGMIFTAAAIFSPLLGKWASGNFGYRGTFLLCAIIVAVAGSVGLLLNQPHVERKKSAISLKQMIAPAVIPLAIVSGIIMMTTSLTHTYLVEIGAERGINNVELFFTINSIGAFIIRPIAGKIADRKGMSWIVVPAFLCLLAEVFIIADATSLTTLLVAAVLQAIGYGSAYQTLQAASIKLLPLEQNGVANSTFLLGYDILGGAGQIAAGKVASAAGYRVMFFCSAGVLLVGLVLFLFIVVRRKAMKTA